jgi:hypothetical protein
MQLQLRNLIPRCTQLLTIPLDCAKLYACVQHTSGGSTMIAKSHMIAPLCTCAATAHHSVTQRTCSHSCFALSASGSDKVEKLQVKRVKQLVVSVTENSCNASQLKYHCLLWVKRHGSIVIPAGTHPQGSYACTKPICDVASNMRN